MPALIVGPRRVGILNRIGKLAWLSAAMLGVPFGNAAARAGECPCPIAVEAAGSDEAQARSGSEGDAALGSAAKPAAPYHIEQVGTKAIRLISNNPENRYAITLSGSNSDGDFDLQTRAPGEAWHKSLGVELEGKLGAFLTTDLRTEFTEVERDANAELFGLQPLDGGRNRRALNEFNASTRFLGDRVSVTSSRRSSSLMPLESNANDRKGVFEQDRFSAWLWRSDEDGLSIEGALIRVDANYQDLTNTDIDALQARNKQTQQLKSKLNLGWAGVFVTQRQAAALVPDKNGATPRQSEIGTGVSVGLSALQNIPAGDIGHDVLSALPDSVWVSTDRGSVEYDGVVASTPGQSEKTAIGMTQSWNAGGLNLRYWRSAVRSDGQLPEDTQWRGHGMDVAGNLYSGHWTIWGNLSWYKADNVAAWSNSAENSVNGSLFVTWDSLRWPKLTAGVTNYAYQADFFGYHGTEQNSLTRYQLTIDGSRLLAAALSDKDAQLTFLASYQGDKSRSQLVQTGYSSDAGNVFLGFRFARPFLP
jgi:hypothetical protein